MGTNIVPFDSNSNLPAYLQNAAALPDINKDVVRAPAFPSMSIKGKVFTINKDGVKKILTKPGEDDEVAQSIGVVVMRANMGSKNYYSKAYTEGDSDGARPDCYSHDGIAPSPLSANPQAKKCAVCPHNQWGSRMSSDGDRPGTEKKGKACNDQARLAIAAPDKLPEPMLLRVPPASLKNLREAVKVVNTRKIPYNAVVMKISFDPEAASPTLKFKPIGLLSDADYAKVNELYDGELVRSIVGLDDQFEEAPEAQPAVSTDELDAALAARDAAAKASQSSAPAPAAARKSAAKPTPTPAPKPVSEDELDAAVGTSAPAPAPAPVAAAPAPAAKPAAKPAASGASDLLSDLDALLGGTDD